MQIADYVPTWTKYPLQIPFSSQYFSQIHAQKAHVLPACVCNAFLVRHDCLCISKCTICYGVRHRFHYQLYTEKEKHLYMHVLKSYAHIGSVLSSF